MTFRTSKTPGTILQIEARLLGFIAVGIVADGGIVGRAEDTLHVDNASASVV